MDRVTQLSVMSNTDVLKEPRGFIKLLQVILAIFAFATTTAFYDEAEFSIDCPPKKTFTLSFSYPFILDSWTTKGCNETDVFTMFGDFRAPSQFYVFVGVMAFLYSLAAIALYVFAGDKYQQNDSIPAADLVITVIFVLLWLISSSAWGDGLYKVKHYSDPENVYMINGTPVFHIYNSIYVIRGTSYASLNVSIIFGFLNMLVWAGNIWFLYKETKWFGGSREQQGQVTNPGSP